MKRKQSSRQPARRRRAPSVAVRLRNIARSFADRVPTWKEIWGSCWKQARSWGVPPRWAERDWHEELLGVAEIATCLALRSYDPTRNTMLEAYTRLRVQNALHSRLRQEWSQARHIDYRVAADDLPAAVEAECPERHDLLLLALSRLAEYDRMFIMRIFRGEETQEQIAKDYKKSQPWVSKRKLSILKMLRQSIDHELRVNRRTEE